MKTLFLATILLAAAAWGDDRMRDVQAELKSEGFFYGTVDGKAGAETTAAIRRFQIRNGLQVTGAVNDETLRALGMDGKGAPSPEPPQPTKKKPSEQVNPPPAETTSPSSPKGKDLLRHEPSADAPRDTEEDPATRPVRPRMVPDDSGVIPPPRSLPPATLDDWNTFYHGTPYATAPREVQTSVLRKAQDQLVRRRLYHGQLDGTPSPATSEALFLYQEQRRLTRTGRLDLATLADLNLLPGRGPEAPPLKPFYNPNRRRDPSVDVPGYIR